MKGLVSFHAIDVELFDETLIPLVVARKINPEPFLDRALTLRKQLACSRRYMIALEELIEVNEPPQAEPGAGLLSNLKAQLRRLDHKDDPLAVKAREAIDPELHLYGRPYLITESSTARVAERVHEYVEARDEQAVEALILEQLLLIDKELPRALEAFEVELGADLSYRSELLAELKALYDIPFMARQDGSWGPTGGGRRPAREVLLAELPWRAVALHGRVRPFWVGRDVDGLETVCRAAGVEPPEVLAPAWRLFSEAIEEFPDLKESLHLELQGPRDVGAFVAAADVPALVDFLSVNGGRIIQIATRHGEGQACSLLLRKIRECAAYAAREGLAYLEASGNYPADVDPQQWEDPETPE